MAASGHRGVAAPNGRRRLPAPSGGANPTRAAAPSARSPFPPALPSLCETPPSCEQEEAEAPVTAGAGQAAPGPEVSGSSEGSPGASRGSLERGGGLLAPRNSAASCRRGQGCAGGGGRRRVSWAARAENVCLDPPAEATLGSGGPYAVLSTRIAHHPSHRFCYSLA